MDIAELSMAMSQANLFQNIGTAMLAKGMDQAEATGEAMAEMIESCPDPIRGHNIDLSI